MNKLWIPMQKRYNTNESETWRLAGKEAMLYAEVTKAAADRGIGDLLKYLQTEKEEQR